jgi:serine phosphatase RsbU (regulator of sigma subunit)
LWLVAVVTLALVGVVVYTYLGYRQAATNLVLERDEQVTELSAARLQQALANYGELLSSLARSREMSGGGVGTQIDALSAAAPRLSVFDGGVFLIDGRGRVRGALPNRPVLIARDWSDRDFYQTVLGGAEMALADGQQLFPGDPYTIVLAAPIRGDDDAFIGALAGAFRLGEPTLSVFYANIVRLRLGQTGTTYVVDGKGRILFDSESQEVGRFLDFDQLLYFSSLSGAAAALTQDRAGRAVIAAYSPVPGTNWTLIVEDDWSIVTRETSRYRDILLLSFLAAMLLPTLGLVLLSRQRHISFLEVRRPEQETGWLKAVREQLRPAQLPVLPGWQLFAQQTAGRGAEHDFYDVALLPDGRLSLALGKLSAGGVQAGVALASTRAILTSAGQRLLGPSETLEDCNRLLSTQFPASLTVRCLTLLLDPSTGKAEYAAAGVSPPRLRDGRWVQDAPVGGQPLGPNARAEIETGEARLGPRSLMILLGPSMLEARDGEGRAFADEALNRVLDEWRSGVQELVDRILDAFKAFNEKSPFFPPDLTVIVLERQMAEK